MAEYPSLTPSQIAAVLRTALDPNNHFLPVNGLIRIPFLVELFKTLAYVEGAAGSCSGSLLDERIDLSREILRIGCHFSEITGVFLWYLGVCLSLRFDKKGIKQDLEESIRVLGDCSTITNHLVPRWNRL